MWHIKKIYSKAAGIVVLLLAPGSVFAQANQPLTVAEQVLATLNVVVSIVFVLAVVVFGWGIIKLIVSAGNPEAVKQAKGYLIWGIIGIAVLASVFGIITYLQEFVGVAPGGGNIPTPTVGQ